MAKPLVIASLEAACDDNRVRKESNDSVTLTPTNRSPSIEESRRRSIRSGGVFSDLNFDVEYQTKVTLFAVGQPGQRYSHGVNQIFFTLSRKAIARRAVKFVALR